jgi:hypothetical protein
MKISHFFPEKKCIQMYIVEVIPLQKGVHGSICMGKILHLQNELHPGVHPLSWSVFRNHKATWCLAGSIVTILLQCSIKLPRWWVDVNVCPYIHINSPYTMFPLYCNCEATGQHMIGFVPRNVWCSNGSNFLMHLVFGFHPEWILHTATKAPLFKLSPSSYLLVTHITSHGPEWTSTHQCTMKDGFCKW